MVVTSCLFQVILVMVIVSHLLQVISIITTESCPFFFILSDFSHDDCVPSFSFVVDDFSHCDYILSFLWFQVISVIATTSHPFPQFGDSNHTITSHSFLQIQVTPAFAHLVFTASYFILLLTSLHMCLLLFHHAILKFLLLLRARYSSLSSQHLLTILLVPLLLCSHIVHVWFFLLYTFVPLLLSGMVVT